MPEGIKWSCVCRNDVILAEVGEDHYDGAVIELSQKLLKRKPTPGWEFQRNKKLNLRAMKLHVYEDAGQKKCVDDVRSDKLIWIFAVVSDSSLEKDQVKSFLEKLVFLTEPMRQDDEWRNGQLLCAQSTFAPTLLQRMEQVDYQGRLAMVNHNINSTKEIMSNNIDRILERDEHLHNLEERSSSLNLMSKQFKKRSKELKRKKMWQNAKHGAVMGTAITAGVAAITIPPLIALL
uniref:V-SNARE coiled-coil homology domain-containing protein n=1 Tax=Eucampia antarctica TaxID=49252 RepID=A0A7S2SDH1_9STRA|mmetsp:Transcript_6472/g.6072  ORF Transcript_6472/g.6072 Transcript_6472/m.6072 type:complete len:234 (+) Transcript_6472:140-841(+)|eukprot:CAMPEP_0197833814 /NCGR_PEP_ID=MMETSP1437-20131217/20200_1 /TAXON_ID=49252 ORGANISM="Eucampia antarctica, Strain CCMP1452" /NCGR_SAMPLE_ID=MMETSP1437 /ASSEMBLY_ACC=CAM_ASM_001096 /LENGTH=233 /DNA_ID=CAMNT_0043438087 /DNA_START=129 /DNA_END=830 /DNA_ORIENTATION=-